MVFGTHRLLSDDICFKDLGLLIVDEEQRFGVSQKEKIKELVSLGATEAENLKDLAGLVDVLFLFVSDFWYFFICVFNFTFVVTPTFSLFRDMSYNDS